MNCRLCNAEFEIALSTFLFTASVSSYKSTQLDIVDGASLIRRCGVTNDHFQPLWLHPLLTLARPSGMLAQLRMILRGGFCYILSDHFQPSWLHSLPILARSKTVHDDPRNTVYLKTRACVFFLAHWSSLLMTICHATLHRVSKYV